MAEQLIYSESPLFFDTLPALKTRWGSGGDVLYCLARFYQDASAFHLSLSAFERDPAPESRLALALAAQDGRGLLAQLSPREARLIPFGPQAPLNLFAEAGTATPAKHFAGDDEQGWYWGAQLAIGRDVLEAAGIGFDEPVGIALFKHAGGPGFSASCALHGGQAPGPGQFPVFVV